MKTFRRLLPLLLLLCMLAAVAGAGAALAVLDREGVTPRQLAPYLAQRSSGHNALIENAGSRVASFLDGMDRAAPPPAAAPPGAGAGKGAGMPPGAADIVVANVEQLRKAMAAANPGDIITLLPGRYHLVEPMPVADRPGRADAPITVRAATPRSVELALRATEGFRVSAPYWRFDDLDLRGACDNHSECEHAFHIVAHGHHFSARNNLITDFNAHFKINGQDGAFPDHGLIEGNTLTNSAPRQTANPVTPIDLVAASGWTIRRNLITDFVKLEGNRVSFGAFAKGGGSGNRFERNTVICEQRLRGQAGSRIGLSLGGGGSDPNVCRDRRCITEQQEGRIESNLIMACSDDGIYVNSAAASQVVHNTVLDTAGIDVRFASSSATVDGNLVDGPIRARNGGLIHEGDNLATATAMLYLGRHPQRALFQDAAAFDLRWQGAAPRRAGGTTAPDLCTDAARPAAPTYGAFEDYAACAAKR